MAKRGSCVRSGTCPAGVAVLAIALLVAASLRADTVTLKDGTQIKDCQVTSETETHVYLRTPVGNMGVPRTEILRVQRVKTVYDTYAEQLAQVREDDVNGLYKLALWCRTKDGLRKQSNELLAKVVELNEKHDAARRLLGHIKVGDRWVVPPPLVLDLRVSGADSSEFRSNMNLFLETRTDVRLASEAESKAESKAKPKSDSEAGSAFERCRLEASVLVVRKAATRVYGQAMGQGSLGVSVRLQAQSPWLGRTPVKTAVDGMVPSDSGDTGLGVQNALSRGGMTLHRFLDQVTAVRSKQLEVQLRKEEREKKVSER